MSHQLPTGQPPIDPVVEQAIRLLSLASRAAACGELRSAAGRRIACLTGNT
jgi:hypothetical protein